MKNSYRINLLSFEKSEHEIKPTEGTEITSADVRMNVFIEAASIRDAEEGAMAYALKLAPDIPWKITCAEEMRTCTRGEPWN